MKKTQNKGRSRSFKVIKSVSIESPYATSSYCFGVIAAYCSNFGHFASFSPPFFGGLWTTYDVHLGLIGKRVVDFPLGLITEVFSLGVTAEALQAKINRKSGISLQRGQFDSKFQVEGDVPYQSFFCTDS